MLIDQEAADMAREMLESEDFYAPIHQEIFRASEELSRENRAVDMVTVLDKLEQRGMAEACGGVKYLSELARDVPTAANVRHYIRIVEEKSLLRKLIKLGGEMVSQGFAAESEVDKILEDAQKNIYDLAVKKNSDTLRRVDRALIESYEKILEAAQSKTGITGVPSGFGELDYMTTGLHPGELVVIAGRPGTGKTSFALNIARNVAKRGLAVAVFSLEMSREQLATRLLCTDAPVDLKKARSGQLSDEDYEKLAKSMKIIAKLPVYIDDSAGITVPQIRSKAMRLGVKEKLGLVIIDYLQLMPSSGKMESRVLEVADMTRSLKTVARDLGVPVLALSQLSREMERRKGGKPMLSDLRESGAIEQDADIVMFLYKAEDEQGNPEENTMNLLLAKNRNGPTAGLQLAWQPEYTRFLSIERKFEKTEKQH
jgi:replicative DNA helicase